MKTYGGVDVEIHIFLASALVGCEWTASRSCRFTPRKQHRYPLSRRLDGPQSRSERCGEEKKFAVPGIEPGASNQWPVAIPTELITSVHNVSKERSAYWPYCAGNSYIKCLQNCEMFVSDADIVRRNYSFRQSTAIAVHAVKVLRLVYRNEQPSPLTCLVFRSGFVGNDTMKWERNKLGNAHIA
jgi:hypothetical protein